MKRLLLITALYGCLLNFASAQAPASKNTIKGTVTDSVKNEPLAFVTLTFADPTTGKTEKSVLTKDNGSFEVNGLQQKAYQLTATFVGYKPHTITLNAGRPANEVINIKLSPLNSQLNEVAIKSTRQLVKQEIDRLSYDVQADPESKAMTALDMLRKVPLVSVDGDDNIQLQGSGDYKIFINGKPSPLLVSNPKDILRSMPANTIQKIEVITTPPAKYDAEGLAGIINIITIRKTADGYNGTLSSRYNTVWGSNLNLSTTARAGKFGFSVSGALGHQTNNTTGNQNLRQTFGTPTSNLVQNGANAFGGNFKYASGEFSYELDTLNLLTASFNYNYGNFNQDNTRSSNFNDQLGTVQSYYMFNDGDFDWRGTDVSLNYQKAFKRDKNQLLTFSYQYSYSLNAKNNDVFLTQQVNYPLPNFNQLNNAGGREHTLQVDYVQPAKQWNIEAGAKAILRSNFSDFESGDYIAASNSYNVDPARSNNFNYHQDVYAVYNSYQYKLAKWTFKGGLRAEHTHIDANFISNSTALDRDYTNLVPSLSILRTLDKKNSLTLGITNRLQRPYIQQLNPFVDKTNLQLVTTGNPDLKPVISHLFELAWTKVGTGSITTRLSYMYTNNSIENVTRVLSDTLSQTTYDNVGQNKTARINFNGSYPFTPKFSVNFNTGIFYVWISGVYNGQFYSNRGPRTNTFISSTYKLNSALQLGASFGYNRRYINLQGSSNDYYYSTVSATYTVKNFTFSGLVNNPFQRYYLFTTFNDTDAFYQSNSTNQLYRNMNISVSYKFGRLSSGLKKNKRGINNDDATSSGN